MPKWKPCIHAGRFKRSDLSDRGKCAKCAKKAMSTGGCKASKEAKRLAGRKGGKWSGMMRRSVRKLSKDGVSILTRTGHTSRQKLYSSDITFGEFVTESNLMDQRKKTQAVVLTQNVILQYAYIERIDKTRDFVFRETRIALLATMRHRRRGWRKACVRIVIAVVFLGAPRGAAPACKSLAYSADLMSDWIETAACGLNTFRMVLSRKLLAKSVLEAMAISAVKKLANEDVFELANRIAQAAYDKHHRRPQFHAVEVAWWLSLIPCLGFSFQSDAVPTRVGSLKGLSIVRAQSGNPNLDEDTLAEQTGLSRKHTHTALCAYSKYVKWYHSNITRWYLDQPKCCLVK